MITAAIEFRQLDGDFVFAGTLMIALALLIFGAEGLLRLHVWIFEGRPGTAGRLRKPKRRKPRTSCPTTPSSTHGVAR